MLYVRYINVFMYCALMVMWYAVFKLSKNRNENNTLENVSIVLFISSNDPFITTSASASVPMGDLRAIFGNFQCLEANFYTCNELRAFSSQAGEKLNQLCNECSLFCSCHLTRNDQQQQRINLHRQHSLEVLFLPYLYAGHN